MKVKIVDTTLTTNSAGQVVESLPVLPTEDPYQDAAGFWRDPITMVEDANGIPIRVVDQAVVLNSAGQPVTAARGEGVGYGVESEAFFGRLEALSVPATGARKAAIDRCIRALIASGAWAERDGYYGIGATELAWRQNWKQNAYNLTLVGAPTFVADRYVAGNGSNAAYDTGFNPTTAVGANYQQNDCSMFVVLASDLANAGGVSYEIGNFSAWIGRHNSVPGRSSCRPQAASTVSAGNQSFPGEAAWSRSGASLWEGYAHGLDHPDGGGTTASAALNNSTIRICAANGFGWGVNQVMFAGFGGNLTAAQKAGETKAIRRYLQDIGAIKRGIVAYGDSTAFGTGATNWSTTWLRKLGDDYSPVRIPATRGVAGYTPADALALAQADGSFFDDQVLVIMDLPASGETIGTWATDIKALIAATGASRWLIMPPAQDSTGGPVQVVTDAQAALLSDPFFAGHTLGASDQAAYLAAVSGAGTRADNKHFNDSGQAIQAYPYAKALMDAASY